MTDRVPVRTQRLFDREPERNRPVAALERASQDALRRVDRDSARAPQPTIRVTGNYQAHMNELVLCDPRAGAFRVMLPKPTRGDSGRQVTVKNATGSTNNITVDPGAAALDGAVGPIIMATAYYVLRFMTDGQAWWMV